MLNDDSQPSPIRFNGETYRIDHSLLRRPNPSKRRKHWAVVVGLLVAAYAMDYLLYVILFLTALLSIVFLVVPLLHFLLGKKVSAISAGFIIPKVMGLVDIKYSRVRAQLLKKMSGRVLDIGSGGGAYFQYAFASEGNVSSLTALEPNLNCHSALRKKVADLKEGRGFVRGLSLTQKPKVTIISDFIEDHLEKVGENSYDFAILGNVLCEVPNPQSVLRSLDQLLVPGAQIYFSEHVRSKSWIKSKLQDFLAPWWWYLADGCNCNRDTMTTICETCPMWVVQPWTFEDGDLPWIGPFVVGLAMKPK
eukprot:g2549.t1